MAFDISFVIVKHKIVFILLCQAVNYFICVDCLHQPYQTVFIICVYTLMGFNNVMKKLEFRDLFGEEGKT